MAKQRGLHQIIGKYNDTCYFERKGTRGGLLRRINSGMSERVKSGEDFANLRSANSIFGACSIYAAIVFNFFSNRSLFLFKKNRQSQLTRLLFKLRSNYFISNDSLRAGFGINSANILALLFDSVVRKKFYDVFSGIPRTMYAEEAESLNTITLNETELEEYCRKYNADGCYIGTLGPCYIYPLVRTSVNDKFQIQDFGSIVPRYGYTWRRGGGDLEIDINVGTIDDTASFGFIYAIPEKDVLEGLPIRLYTGSCCGMFNVYIG